MPRTAVTASISDDAPSGAMSTSMRVPAAVRLPELLVTADAHEEIDRAAGTGEPPGAARQRDDRTRLLAVAVPQHLAFAGEAVVEEHAAGEDRRVVGAETQRGNRHRAGRR